MCVGHPAGCEAAIHALRNIFQDMDTDAVLLIDADNAFNHLNRTVALHNIQYTYPPLATIALNFYCTPSRLFVNGGMERKAPPKAAPFPWPYTHSALFPQSISATTQQPPTAMQPHKYGLQMTRLQEFGSTTLFLDAPNTTQPDIWVLS